MQRAHEQQDMEMRSSENMAVEMGLYCMDYPVCRLPSAVYRLPDLPRVPSVLLDYFI